MQDYNPKEVAKKDSPEQQIIRDTRNTEFERQFKRTSEEKLNQDKPNPFGVFDAEVRSVARSIVERASDLTNKKRKGKVANEEYAAQMATVQSMVGNLKNIKNAVSANLAAYNSALKNGLLSYGMDQFDEGVLIGLNKGEINLDLDSKGRIKLTGKGRNALKGDFDVNIFDAVNIPAPVKKIPPINLVLGPAAKKLGLDKNGQPKMKVDKNGRKYLDTGEYKEHKLEILGAAQKAITAAGPGGVRSYLGDHMNLSSEEIKNLMESLNFNDGEHEWENAGNAKVFQSLNEYLENKYQRQRKPHPDTLAANVSNQASEIAAGKNVRLKSDDIRPFVTQTNPQGGIQATDAVQGNTVQPQIVPQSPLSFKDKSKKKWDKKANDKKVMDLIKKYSK